jgi:hypothetical protein
MKDGLRADNLGVQGGSGDLLKLDDPGRLLNVEVPQLQFAF